MKRTGNLFNQITDFNNLRSAYLKALKGKRYSADAINFARNADENLCCIKEMLEKKLYKPGGYHQFKIYDPKERIITAATFTDRIVHHAIMNILAPVFERKFIYHTYACRKNKGTHKAVAYVFNKAKICKYFLKLDVRKYFDSISHNKLKGLLSRIIKDEKCLFILISIIDSYSVNESIADETGLPIGNLTSQFFANYYLSFLDHFVLEQLKPSGYVRYMDDIIVFSNSKIQLKLMFTKMEEYISKLNLFFKQPLINSCRNGIPFLGYLITGGKISLLNRNRKRKIKKIKELEYNLKIGRVTEDKFCSRYNSILNVQSDDILNKMRFL